MMLLLSRLLCTDLGQTEVVGFADSSRELFVGLVVQSPQMSSVREPRWHGRPFTLPLVVLVLVVTGRWHGVRQLQVVTADDVNPGEVLADRFTELRVVGGE